MQQIKIFILTILLTSCSYESKLEQSMNQFTLRFSKEINKEYGLYLFGRGGSVPEKIRTIDINFQSNQTVELAAARHLVIVILEQMIDEINADDNLIPYLEKYPAGIKNAVVSIGFNQSPKLKHENLIDFVAAGYGKISYAKTNSKDDLRVIYEETFEEAKQILQTEKER